MEILVLVAVASDLLRRGLRAVFEAHPFISHVIEATTSAELLACLETHLPDRIVIHQSLIEDISTLPKGRFIILADQPDKHMLLAALYHHARAYLLESTSIDQLMSLLLSAGKCSIDPALTTWLLEVLANNTSSLDAHHEPLTPREQEILKLRNQGLSNHVIAEQLYISVNTVKSHFLHIAEKRGTKRQRKIDGK
jgi:DNA-binding NarL/FixJ family response regulator